MARVTTHSCAQLACVGSTSFPRLQSQGLSVCKRVSSFPITVLTGSQSYRGRGRGPASVAPYNILAQSDPSTNFPPQRVHRPFLPSS